MVLNLNKMQELELEFEMKNLKCSIDGSGGDVVLRETITKLQRDLEDRETNLQDIMNSLVQKERNNNNEYQDALEEMVKVRS